MTDLSRFIVAGSIRARDPTAARGGSQTTECAGCSRFATGLRCGLPAEVRLPELGQAWLRNLDLHIAGGLEVGAARSPEVDGRRDFANMVSLPVTLFADVAPHWQVGATAGFPFLVPVSAVYAGGSVHWRARAGGVSGFAAHLGMRGVFSPVVPCGGDTEQCPDIEGLDDPLGPIYWGVGLMGEVGVSYQWSLGRKLRVRVAAQYLAGPMRAQRRDAGILVDGYYRGTTVSVSLAL